MKKLLYLLLLLTAMPVTLEAQNRVKEFSLERRLKYMNQRRPDWHAGVTYVFGATEGIALHGAANYHDFDLELTYMFGIQKSDVVNWYNAGQDSNPYSSSATYRPNVFSAKFGYQFNPHKDVSIVPQLGVSMFNLKAEAAEGSTDKLGDGSGCTCAVIGCRMVYSPLKQVGLYVSPEYNIAVSKSDTYQKISDVTNIPVGGFFCHVGLLFHF